MEIFNGTELFVDKRHLELDSSCFPNFLGTALVLEGDKPLFISKQWLTNALAATETMNSSFELDLEVFYSFLAFCVVHVKVNFNFLTWRESLFL